MSFCSGLPLAFTYRFIILKWNCWYSRTLCFTVLSLCSRMGVTVNADVQTKCFLRPRFAFAEFREAVKERYLHDDGEE